jgi:hypothetical protein
MFAPTERIRMGIAAAAAEPLITIVTFSVAIRGLFVFVCRGNPPNRKRQEEMEG